jgi:hypothetical protein
MLRQLPKNSPVFKNYHFFINEEVEDCDYWFVYNFLNNKSEKVFCPKENIILIAPEPEHVQKYYTSYLAQFNTVISNQQCINHKNNIIYQTGAPWFVNKTYDELSAIENVQKNKAISIITSNKAFTKSHKLRLDFALKLKEYFKDKIDLFGRGIKDFDDKWDVLKNYKYTIAIENGAYNDYFTEKITDSFLSYTYPLYYGCKNISRYFSEESFKYIDIENFEKSKLIIEEILDSPFYYEDKLPIIKESRMKCLNEYNVFELMINFIENRSIAMETKKELLIYNSFNDFRTLKEKIENKITKTLIWK